VCILKRGYAVGLCRSDKKDAGKPVVKVMILYVILYYTILYISMHLSLYINIFTGHVIRVGLTRRTLASQW
jgi:hypothetical protein